MGDSESDFATDFLNLHNQYRAIHKSPPLQLNDELSDHAQEWADSLAQRGVIEYRPETEYGENLYVRDVPPDIKPKDPLERWYREGRYFKYGEAEVQNLDDVRQFTQMLWNESKSIGLGLATGSDERIYLVCNYDPPGNVNGEFDKNVSPVMQEEKDSQKKKVSHEDDEDNENTIITVPRRISVVESMERLYAVPSEKLRVWSVWLTKVGEISDEWQRWLRSYIDFTIRLSDYVREAQETIRKRKEEQEEGKSEFESGEEDDGRTVDAFGDSTQDQGTSVDQLDEATDESESPDDIAEEDAEDAEDAEEAVDAEEAEEAVDAEEAEAAEDAEDTGTLKATSEATLTEDKDKDKDKDKEEVATLWPIGRPWEETGSVDKLEEDEFEKLPLPTTEEEMEEIVQKFTQEATIFRSYYKHWSDTADQAVKEIGGRLVLATYITQGKESKQKKKLRLEKSRSSEYYSATSVLSQRGANLGAKSMASVNQPELEEDSVNEADDTPAEAAEDDESVVIPIGESKSDTPTVIENVPRSTSSRLSKKSTKTESSRDLLVSDLVRDCARAAEPIPYFFYLRAEPDIDIAIEHDDEAVIPADPDREKIRGNYKRLFYNLADKPCKGGKPWL